MKAVVCKAFGPPENLVVEELADPTPGPGQVLVEVKAAAVTFPDTLMLEDRYQYKATLPYVPGGEVARYDPATTILSLVPGGGC